MMRRIVAVLALLTAAGCSSGASSAPLPLRRVEDVALPGSTGRFDYASLDTQHHLLVVAHLADSTVIAVDTAARRVAWLAHGVSDVHGVRAVPELGRVFASATGTNEVVAIDESTGAVVGRTPTGRFPDGLAHDPGTQRVFVSDKDGGTETVVDARTLAVIGTVDVGGDVGNVQLDDAEHVMVAAVGRTNELVFIDPASLRVERRLGLPGCRGAHGVALDAAGTRAFVACEDNATVLTVHLGRGVVDGRQRTGRTPDVLAFDAGLGRLYVAAEDGVVSVFALRGSSIARLGSSHIAAGAHSVAVDTVTHLVYLPIPDVGGRAVLRIMSPT